MARSESLLPGGVRISDLVTLGALAEGVPAEEIDAAIAGLEGKRRTRSLPPRLTVLYVIAMAVYRDVSLEEVLSCLLEGLRWLGFGPIKPAVKSAITQARIRLGSTPLRLLFERLARPLATDLTKGSHYRSWLTVAFDGTVLDLPDTQSNVKAYGYPGASRVDLRLFRNCARSHSARPAPTPRSPLQWDRTPWARFRWPNKSFLDSQKECFIWPIETTLGFPFGSRPNLPALTFCGGSRRTFAYKSISASPTAHS